MHALRRVAAILLASSLLVVPAGSAVQGAASTCLGKQVTIRGSAGADRIQGTAGPDVIAGLGGDDRIDADAGSDRICGGRGADRIDGGPGTDHVHGGPDQLAQGPAGSYLVGDVLVGGAGDDMLEGGTDRRSADRRRRPDTYSWADAPRPVTVDLSGSGGSGAATGWGKDTLALGTASGVVGSAYADTIVGSARGDHLRGGDGGDDIAAGGGADVVYPDGSEQDGGRDTVDAGQGADLVSSLAGRDTITTGRGDDFIEAFSERPTIVRVGPGDDYLGQNITPGTGAVADGGAGDDVVAFYGALLTGQRPWARFTIDDRRGTTGADGEIRARGTIREFEGHRLVGQLRWRFHGDGDADRVWAIQGGPLEAHGYGGRDQLIGSNRPDDLAGGSGSDYADGRGGKDRCRSIERGRC